MRHQMNGEIRIDGKRRGNWTAIRKDGINGFNNYHCIITFTDDDDKPMFSEFMVRGVGENNHPMALAGRVLSEGFHKLGYVNG